MKPHKARIAVARMYPSRKITIESAEEVIVHELPDGTCVQLNRYKNGQWDLWVVNPETGERRDCFCVASSFCKPDRHFNE